MRYDAVNAMLLNEFLREHRKLEGFQATVPEQQKELRTTIQQQDKQIEALTATVQKVSDQVKLNKPMPQLVAKDR